MSFRTAILLVALAASPATVAEERAMKEAKGRFDVKVTPLPADEGASPTLGRMRIEKTFEGGLVGQGRGQMLTAGSGDSSGVYVATEVVEGTVDGRKGSFALVHRGIMTRGTPELSVLIVPDSGTGELEGISGALDIEILAGGEHRYTLRYAIND